MAQSIPGDVELKSFLNKFVGIFLHMNGHFLMATCEIAGLDAKSWV